MPLFWELSPSDRPGFNFSSCTLRYLSQICPNKLPVAIKIPLPSVMIFTSTSAYDGMHASVFHTLVSKYNNYFCSNCAQQMGSKCENINTIPTDSFLFSLFLCTSEGALEELIEKKGESKIGNKSKTGKLM